jgi:mRNA interferase YafQ
MFRIVTTNNFEKDVVKCSKRGLNLDLLEIAVKHLENKGALPQTYKPHLLSGRMSSYWECHIKSNWLLIWSKNVSERTITLIGTGAHSDLF